MEPRFVYMTASDRDEAARIGRCLVEERLVACVNIIDGMQAIYRWEGEICEDTEAVLIAKTEADRLTPLIARVNELHSYSTPCVVSLPIEEGSAPYLEWILKQTRPLVLNEPE